MRKFREDFSALLQRMRCVTALCVLCLLLAAGNARAAVGDVFKVDGITYKVLTTSTLQVGNGTNIAIAFGNTSCVIPATVSYSGTNYTVTSIGDYAFQYCSSLTSATLPASLTSIGDEAFIGCSRLTSVTFPESLTSIGDRAFDGCSGLTSVTFPASLTSIGDYAFQYCSSLTAFIVPSENPAFCALDGVLFSKDKTGLYEYPKKKSGSSYTVPDGVTSIENSAFSGCSGLTSVTFPSSLTSIGDSAFSRCSGLTSVTFPSSLASIENSAFSGCSGLTSVTFPASLTSIGDSAFYGCSSLTAFIVPSENPAFCALDGVLFSKDKTGLYEYPKKKSGSSYTVPEGVTSIGDSAFSGCSGLTSVTFPASLTSIEDTAFSYCSGLTSVTFPATSSLTSIGDSAFFSCERLTSVTLPASLTSLGIWAFQGCSSLTSVTLPSSLTSIGTQTFKGCYNLTSVTLPVSLTSIGSAAFQNCSGLTSVTIPSSLTSIGFDAFSYCSGLTSVTLPASLTSIGNGAFQYCSGLTSVMIPSSLTSIGNYTFYRCSQLVNIYYLGINEPAISYNAFSYGPSSGRIVYVPNATSGFTAANWGAASIVYGNGALSATLAPEEVVTAGAQWSIDDGVTWHGSGETVSGLALHGYTVKFRDVSGWITPGSQTISVTADTTTTVNGLYTPPPAGIAWSDVLGQE